MKQLLTFSILLFVPVLLYAQLFGEQQVIHQFTENHSIVQVMASDMDLDNDIDVVFMSGDSTILYENLYPISAGSLQTIYYSADLTTNPNLQMDLVDVNSDQYPDVLVNRIYAALPPFSFGGDVEIFINGFPLSFPHSGSATWIQPQSIGFTMIHLNDDSLPDVLTTETGTLGLSGHLNSTFNPGEFGGPNVLFHDSVTSHYVNCLTAADITNDSLEDGIVGYINPNSIMCFQGLQSDSLSAPSIISYEVSDIKSISVDFVNSDNLPDVISASSGDSKIAWYPNLGSGNFGAQQVVTTNALGARDVFAIDLDNDTDIDLLSASYADNKIAWYENDGNGNFGPQQVICDTAMGARSVYAADLDNDGDMDVLSASALDGKVAWYENLLIITDVDEEPMTSASIYPNPATDLITIRLNGKNEEGGNVVITDVLGRPVFSSSVPTGNMATLTSEEIGKGFFLVYFEPGPSQRQFLGKLVVR